MFFLVIGLVYFGSDFFLLVLEIEDMYSSFYLCFLEFFIIVEVNCINLGIRYCWMSIGFYIFGR